MAIYNIANKALTKVTGLKSFKVPEKWDDYLVYLYSPAIDSTNKKEKKRGKKNGYDLVVKNLKDQSLALVGVVTNKTTKSALKVGWSQDQFRLS